MQRVDSGTSYGGSPHQLQVIFNPSKMSRPTLAAGVKKSDRLPGLGIVDMGFGIFMAVACGARPSELCQSVPGAAHTRQDMLADKRCAGVPSGMLTVFATVVGPVSNLPAHGARDGLTCHPFPLSSQFPPSRRARAC